ncbi:hypothetical protein HanXRQr2_Chr01g0011021 [Helianthus annuus]|uniref:Uncharacterized protein n=1 Tax=Helianthus annuus TaxID=4232 RepID=A0A9K3P241_HELAN|nr:hypothetical protein HanXRQr2_Chr01g0011021 [Helianthus annuus]
MILHLGVGRQLDQLGSRNLLELKMKYSVQYCVWSVTEEFIISMCCLRMLKADRFKGSMRRN